MNIGVAVARLLHHFRVRSHGARRDYAPHSDAESEISIALGAALLATLILGSVVGVESDWELLILLALVAGLALVFDTATLPRVRLHIAERMQDVVPVAVAGAKPVDEEVVDNGLTSSRKPVDLDAFRREMPERPPAA